MSPRRRMQQGYSMTALFFSTKHDLPTHVGGDVPPTPLRLPGITSSPHLFGHLPRGDDVLHALPAFQVSEDHLRHVPIHVVDGLARRGEQGPQQCAHGSGEDDHPQARLQRLLGRRLDLGGAPRQAEDGPVEEDEAGLLVRFGVVEDGLQAGVVGRCFGRDEGARDFRRPLVERKLHGGCVVVEIGPHRRRLFRGWVGNFDLFEVHLHAVKGGEAMDDGPQIGYEAKEGVHRGHGGRLSDRSDVARLILRQDRSGQGAGAKRQGADHVKVTESLE